MASISNWIKIGGVGSPAGQGAVKTQTLTANSTITYAAPGATGDPLVVILTQDGTGGWTITWGASFAASTQTDLDLRANKETKYTFIASGGLWVQTNIPLQLP